MTSQMSLHSKSYLWCNSERRCLSYWMYTDRLANPIKQSSLSTQDASFFEYSNINSNCDRPLVLCYILPSFSQSIPMRQLTAQKPCAKCLHNLHHSTLFTYCNIGAKRSPRTSSTFLIHCKVSFSTASSSSSCNSLINGSISGRSASHSSPSRSVKLSSHRTAASLTLGSSDRMWRRMAELRDRWWFTESAATASSVMAGMRSELVIWG